jgi:hypothetical protein
MQQSPSEIEMSAFSIDPTDLYAKIGQLETEADFLKKLRKLRIL